MSIKGLILDIDGTLVASNDAHAQAWVEAMAEHDINVSVAKVRPLIGMGGDKLLPKAAGVSEESSVGKKISARRGEIFREKHLPTLRPTPGAKELLRHMNERGVRLVIATSAKKDEMKDLLKVCGADEVIEDKTSSDDAENSKPDPDIVTAALEKLGLPHEQVLMLGDTPYDVEAARKAGIGTVAVRCGGWDDAGLRGAVAIYDDPADLLRHFGQSPLANHLFSRSP